MPFSGAGAIRAMKVGDFQATIFAGSEAGLQSAITFCSGGGEIQIGPQTITITGPLTIGSGVIVRGSGWNTAIKIAVTSDIARMFINADTTNGNSNITFRDIKLDGSFSSQSSPSQDNYIMQFTKPSFVTLDNVWIHDWKRIALFFATSIHDIRVNRCKFSYGAVANTQAVYTAYFNEATSYLNTYNIWFTDNLVTGITTNQQTNGFHVTAGQYVTMRGNVFSDFSCTASNGQTSNIMLAGGRHLVFTDNVIQNMLVGNGNNHQSDGIGISSVLATMGSEPSTNLVIANNSFRNLTNGVICSLVSNCSITGNSFNGDTVGMYTSSPQSNGIELNEGWTGATVVAGDGNGISIVGNVVENFSDIGITVASLHTDVTISGNSIRNVKTHGIVAPCQSRLSVTGNTITNYGTAGDNTYYGVAHAGAVAQTSQDVTISDNVFYASNANMPKAAIQLGAPSGGNTCGDNVVCCGNVINGVKAGNPHIEVNNGAPVVYGNVAVGASVAQSGTQGVDTASASTVTLPQFGDTFVVTGTADITSITASWPGRIVTLLFSGTAATNGVVDGSNLKLAGNLAYTPDDALTLRCDGTNWYEVARSAN